MVRVFTTALPVNSYQADVLPVTDGNLEAKKCPWNAALK